MIQKLQKMRAEKGFTLAELLVVILIIAILATLAIVFFTGQTQTAKDNVAGSNLRSAYSAAQNKYVNGDGSYGTATSLATWIGEETSLTATVTETPADGGKAIGVVDDEDGAPVALRVRNGSNYLVKTLPNGADSTVPVAP